MTKSQMPNTNGKRTCRPKLESGMVYCHRCFGFGERCAVCDGAGVLRRERFGRVNALAQHLDANEQVNFANGMPVDGDPKKIIRLQRHYGGEGPTQQEISVYAMPFHDCGHKTAAICAADASGSDAVECRMAVGMDSCEGAPEALMVMPGGTHQITASQSGKPVTVTVQVGPDSAAAMDRALKAHQAAGPQRPYFDFDHKGEAASAWPTGFEWRNEPTPGVYARVEWSKAGEDAVKGKMYRAFSPSFHVDDTKANPARVTGAPLNMGALVNEPAFKKISPLWASSREGDLAAQTTESNMTEQELAALRARLAQLEKDNSELRAAQASSANTAAITAKDEEIAQLKQALGKVESEIKARNTATAKAAVEAAVKRGAIPPKDDAVKARWQAMIEADPANEVLLASLPGNPALAPAAAVTAANAAMHAGGALQAGRVQITREDSQTVIKAYSQARGEDRIYRTDKVGRERSPGARAALERGAIYAADIAPRISRGEDFPLILRDEIQAANSVGTLAADIVLQRTLELLVHNFPAITRFSTDFSGEAAKFNQQIDTRLVQIPAVTDYNTSTGYADSDATTVDVPVKITQHKAVQIAFNEQDLASTARDLFGEQTKAMNYAIGEWFMGYMFSLITVANFPKTRTDTVPFPGTGASNETVAALNGFSRKSVMAVGRALSNRRVPDAMRFMLLSGDYYDKLGEDTVVVSAFNNPQAGDAIATGQLPDVHNFAVSDAKILQTAENLVGFGSFPSALAFAARTPADYTQVFPGVTGGATTQIITEASTGMSLLLVRFVDHKLGQARQRAAFMVGGAKGDDRAGQRIVSGATP